VCQSEQSELYPLRVFVMQTELQIIKFNPSSYIVGRMTQSEQKRG